MRQQWYDKLLKQAESQVYQKALRLFLFILLLLILIILVINIEDFETGFSYKSQDAPIRYLDQYWQKEEVDGIVTLSMTLPEELPHEPTLAIETDHQTIALFIDGELLYERRPDNPWYLGHEIGRIWNLVRLPVTAAGAKIHIEIENYAGMLVRTEGTMLGNANQITRLLFVSVLPLTIFVTFIFVMGVAMLFLANGFVKRGMKRTSGGIAYLGAALIFLSLQTLMDSYMAAFLQINLAFAYIIAQVFYLVLPVLFMQYLRTHVYRFKLVLDLLSVLQLLFLAVVLIAHYKGYHYIVEFQAFIRILLLVYLLICSLITIPSLWTLKGTDENKVPLYSVLFVSLSTMLITAVYSLGYRKMNVQALVLCFSLIFISILAYDFIKRTITAFVTAAEARGLEKLAYEDAMTGLLNRTAFERDLADVNAKIREHEVLGALVLDLNNLKITNDGLGHYKGDFLIASTARIIDETFSPYGRVYRYGGDEFIILLVDKDVARIPDLMVTFKSVIQTYNEEHEIPISVSWGFSSMSITSEVPGDSIIRRVIDKADERMYSFKRRQAAAARIGADFE